MRMSDAGRCSSESLALMYTRTSHRKAAMKASWKEEICVEDGSSEDSTNDLLNELTNHISHMYE